MNLRIQQLIQKGRKSLPAGEGNYHSVPRTKIGGKIDQKGSTLKSRVQLFFGTIGPCTSARDGACDAGESRLSLPSGYPMRGLEPRGDLALLNSYLWPLAPYAEMPFRRACPERHITSRMSLNDPKFNGRGRPLARGRSRAALWPSLPGRLFPSPARKPDWQSAKPSAHSVLPAGCWFPGS